MPRISSWIAVAVRITLSTNCRFGSTGGGAGLWADAIPASKPAADARRANLRSRVIELLASKDVAGGPNVAAARVKKFLFLQHELLHPAAVRGFADIEIPLVVDTHAVGADHLADLVAAVAEFADDFEIGAAQNPNFVIRAVGDIEPGLIGVGRKNGNKGRTRGKRRRRD